MEVLQFIISVHVVVYFSPLFELHHFVLAWLSLHRSWNAELLKTIALNHKILIQDYLWLNYMTKRAELILASFDSKTI